MHVAYVLLDLYLLVTPVCFYYPSFLSDVHFVSISVATQELHLVKNRFLIRIQHLIYPIDGQTLFLSPIYVRKLILANVPHSATITIVSQLHAGAR